jgi:hypothetical protein
MAVEFVVVAFHPERKTIGLFAWANTRPEAEARLLETQQAVRGYVGFTICAGAEI